MLGIFVGLRLRGVMVSALRGFKGLASGFCGIGFRILWPRIEASTWASYAFLGACFRFSSVVSKA